MLTQILITVLVMVAAFGLQRLRSRQRQDIPVIRVAPNRPVAPPPPRWLRPGAYALVALVVASSVAWYYHGWREDQRVVIIRVINTTSGSVATYRAHKGSVSGRSFQTVDGLSVRIADAERVEIMDAGE